MNKILLTTLNARYIHASLGLRYLKANLDALAEKTIIREFIIDSRPQDILEKILQENPDIVGFGVYIWNIEETTKIIAMLKVLRPEIMVVIGGPEVSYENENVEISRLADYVISGQADILFRDLCENIVKGFYPEQKFINGPPPRVSELVMPYSLYDNDDIKNRVLYVEASRGCPYKCEFCLSALDKTATPFNIDAFLVEMDLLYKRGARQFKFVDRTFNLKIDSSIKIMRFFLDRMAPNLFLHFELIPDHLPEKLKTVIQEFPEGALQFEIGVQSLDPVVQQRISRKQNNENTLLNLRWLMEESKVHIHSDLIIGLPGETIESIASGFNQLALLGPHEIQVGILKRLKGSPIIRHTHEYGLKFSPVPPYNILETSTIDFNTMQDLTRFARYWDMIGNSGRFSHTLPLILSNQPFERFMKLTRWIYETTGQTHKISLARIFEILFSALTSILETDKHELITAMAQDFKLSGQKGQPRYLQNEQEQAEYDSIQRNKSASRQQRHLHKA